MLASRSVRSDSVLYRPAGKCLLSASAGLNQISTRDTPTAIYFLFHVVFPLIAAKLKLPLKFIYMQVCFFHVEVLKQNCNELSRPYNHGFFLFRWL